MSEETLQQQFNELKDKVDAFLKKPLPDHKHDGIDNFQISFKDLKNQPVLNVEVATIGSGNTGDFQDLFFVNSLGSAITFGVPKGSPKNGQKLIIRIKDAGVAKGITWNAVYAAVGATLPTTTIAGKIVYCGFIYNSTSGKWELVATAQET